MNRPRPLRSPRAARGVSNIIAAILLVAMTIIAGTTLWTLTFHYPTQPITLSYIAKADLKEPVWGDPTDCVPAGYPISPGYTWNNAEQNAWWTECYNNQIGNFSLMNATEIVFTSVAPTNIPLSEIQFNFYCHNTTNGPATTTLVSGTLDTMTWFPGSTTTAPPDAPTLGFCGTFDARDYGGGAFGTLYNRLGIFVPITDNQNVIHAGDTFILYVHTPDSVYDPAPPAYDGSVPLGADADDYHGAPTWCFTTPGACQIKIVYLGNPNQLLATIPVYAISGAGQ